jgi:hypothetical protein
MCGWERDSLGPLGLETREVLGEDKPAIERVGRTRIGSWGRRLEELKERLEAKKSENFDPSVNENIATREMFVEWAIGPS